MVSQQLIKETLIEAEKTEKLLDKIHLEIFKSKKSKGYISKTMGISPSHLSNLLKGRSVFLQKHLDSLNEILGTRFRL